MIRKLRNQTKVSLQFREIRESARVLKTCAAILERVCKFIYVGKKNHM